MTEAEKIQSWMTGKTEPSPFQLEEWKEGHSYFIPLHYLDARNNFRAKGEENAAIVALYTGNSLLYAEFTRSHHVPAETISINQPEELPGQEMKREENFVQPVYTEDYFLHQGINVSNDLPEVKEEKEEENDQQSLMVVMSFSEWLHFFKKKSEAEKEEEAGKSALKTMWQMEKLSAAMEEEKEEIPEEVFQMAINSIAKEEGLVSESLAEILLKQGKPDKAIEMYKKLSLRNPQKNTYFARKIEEIIKENEL